MAKLNEKRKKKKKEKSYACFYAIYFLAHFVLTLFGNQKNLLWFWVLWKKFQKNRRFSKRARARGGEGTGIVSGSY